jgi:hypothetical protein
LTIVRSCASAELLFGILQASLRCTERLSIVCCSFSPVAARVSLPRPAATEPFARKGSIDPDFGENGSEF